MGVRTISGFTTLWLYIYGNLDAWFSIWSSVNVIKSPNIISHTGSIPASERPLPIPMIEYSLIVVPKTREGNLSESPFVTLNAPPYGSHISSPSMTIRSSLSMFDKKQSRMISLILRLSSYSGLLQEMACSTTFSNTGLTGIFAFSASSTAASTRSLASASHFSYLTGSFFLSRVSTSLE